MSPRSESLELIKDVLVNACLTNNVLTTRTSLTPKTEVCDYMFTSRNIEVSSFAVLVEVISDHATLIMEVG